MPWPAQSRRRARLRSGLILAVLAIITFAPGVLDLARHRDPGKVAMGFVGFGALLIGAISQQLANADFWPALRLTGEQRHLIAAKTMTGWRTIDMTRIRRVHYSARPVRAGSNYLIIIDADGSRIGLKTTDRPAMGWVRHAVASGHIQVHVSRRALDALDIHRDKRHGYRSCRNTHPMLYMFAIWAGLLVSFSAAVGLLQLSFAT